MSRRSWFSTRYLWLIIMVFMGSGAFGAYEYFTTKTDKTAYIFGAVDRGSVATQVEMTGTLAAVTTVAVGTQVSGTVEALYADFNSEVKKGQILAKLDPALFQTQVEQAQASVKTDEAILNNDVASIATMNANVEKARVDVLNTTRKYKLMKELYDEGLETKDDLDSAQASMEASTASQKAAQCQLEASQSAMKADQARLDQARANLKNSQVNLEHSIITSPISGTVISRNVDVGQTVAASFSTPTMFTIGEDLTKMQVSTNTDEADVGKLKAGMEATFTVDAYPGEVFHGKIRQVRLAATTVQNVVTYNAMIDVSNPDLKLKPGMTANVKVIINKVDNVLRVPNAALRFKPALSDAEMLQAFKRAGEERFYSFYKNQGNRNSSGASMRASGPRPAGGPTTLLAGGSAGSSNVPGESGASSSVRSRRAPIWTVGPDGTLRPVVVRLGLTDGVQTEILDGNLKAGSKIILSAEIAGSGYSSSTRTPRLRGPMGRMR